MKHITWLAVLFATASAGWAAGCACSSDGLMPVRENVILSPVGECAAVQTTSCAMPRSSCITDHRTVYAPECPNCRWVPPDKNNPAYVIGNVLTFPFRAITGRELGQPDVVATHQISEPMARKVYTSKTRTSCHVNKCGEPYMKKVTIMKEAGLEPVGERLTTVKVIRLKPMPTCEMPSCPPVGEQLCPAPVCEQLCPAPVAEKIVIHKSCPLPVAEKTTIIQSCPSSFSCPAPVRERFLSIPSSSCPNLSCPTCPSYGGSSCSGGSCGW